MFPSFQFLNQVSLIYIPTFLVLRLFSFSFIMHIIIFEHFLHVVAEPKFVKSYMHNYLFSGQKILAGWRNFCGMNLFLTSIWETALNKYAQKTLKYIGWQNNFHSSNYHLISNFFLHIKVFEAKKDTIYLKKTNL